MEKGEILKQLLANFTAVSKVQNSQEAYKIIGHIFNLLQKLEKQDKTLSEKLSMITANIRNSGFLQDIQDYANDALALLSLGEAEKKYYLKFKRRVESKEFSLIKKKSNIKKLIEAIQEKIQNAREYTSNLHLPIERGKYAKCLHARVTKNIRIMYTIDPIQRKLIYIDIISKNDFDNSLRIKSINWIEKYNDL